MKIKEVRKFNNEELENKIVELKKELFNLRFQQANGQIEKTSRIREVRKTIAKMKTVITENELNKEV